MQENNEQAIQGEHDERSPAAELAAAVFQFVRAAAAMGSTLGDLSTEKDIEDSGAARTATSKAANVNGSNDESSTIKEDSQIQLLRLRIKHREIIIFPDPQYLCCVVQKIGRTFDNR